MSEQPILEEAALNAVIARIRYRDWSLRWRAWESDLREFRWEWVAEDPVTSLPVRCVSRSWIMPWAVAEEQVVRMAFAAALAAEEHEARERFWYGAERPFDPHRPRGDR